MPQLDIVSGEQRTGLSQQATGTVFRRGMLTLWLIAFAWVAAGCSGLKPLRGVEPSDLDRKYTTFTYIEQGDLVTFLVNTKITRLRDKTAFIPLEIAVGNNGLKQLSLNRESFTLVDAEGRRYPMVTAKEILSGYDFLEFDTQLQELRGIVIDNKFAAYQEYPSNFTPGREINAGIVRDRVALPRYGYFVETLYFPRPVDGVLNQRFELFLDGRELVDPVFVKFEVK